MVNIRKVLIVFALVVCLASFLHACTPRLFSPYATQTTNPARPPLNTFAPTRTFAVLSKTTSIPSPSPTPMTHPLFIETMRRGDYPGSPITIEEKLPPGENYQRYVASYRSQGLKIYALLTVPDGDSPTGGFPVIIFNHGYIPPEEYSTTKRYIRYVDEIAKKGYIVFRSDYRGHGDSEGMAQGAYGTPDYTVDILNAIASIKQYPGANSQRIGMWGHSMGGQITLRVMVVSKDIKAGVIWAGVVAPYVDIFTRWDISKSGPTPTPHASPSWVSSWFKTYGTPEENPAFWAAISPNSYLADISGPLQLHHGTGDKTVPLPFSETLYRQMRDAGKTVEFFTYERDDHNLSNYFYKAMERTINFFDLYVKGE